MNNKYLLLSICKINKIFLKNTYKMLFFFTLLTSLCSPVRHAARCRCVCFMSFINVIEYGFLIFRSVIHVV